MTTILELRDVKYFFDGKNYYKKINNNTLQKITKEEFYAKSKYNPKTINKLLNESVYPYQINDYILLRIPKWLNKTNKKYAPADYQLANLIELLWKKKIIMFHWNQPKNKFGGVGSIDCYKNTLYGKNVIDILEPKGDVTTVTTVTTGIQSFKPALLQQPGHLNVPTAAARAPQLPHENCHLIF